MRTFTLPSLALAVVSSLLMSGCSGASFKLKEPPGGFAVVQEWTGHYWAKAGDDVGLKIASYDNVKGGTLEYWSYDLAEKLGDRGYKLTNQSGVKSKNGVAGLRLDFDYSSPAGEEKFYTAVLFVSDDYRIVVQLAGDKDLRSAHEADLNEALTTLKVKGCKLTKDTCKGPVPASMVGKLATGGIKPGTDVADATANAVGTQPAGEALPEG